MSRLKHPANPSRLHARLRRFFDLSSDRSGAAAVEFGIIVPMLALMAISVTDIGLAVYRKMQVEGAAQAGAQYAIMNGYDSSAITSAVTSATNSSAITATPAPTKFCGCPTGSSISTITCGATCSGGSTAGTYVAVSAQSVYYTFLNYQIVATSHTFNAQSTVRLQ